MSELVSSESRPVRVQTVPSWLLVVVAIPFGLLYAYAVWNAIGTLVAAAANPLGLNAAGWFIWIFSAILPMLVFFFAFLLGRRHNLGIYALTLLAGLGLVAAFWINVVAYTSYNFLQLIG